MPSRTHQLYALIVKCYPADIRRHYGRAMLDLFDDLTNPRLPGYTPPNYLALYADGLWGAIKEQAVRLRQKLTGDRTVPKSKPQSPPMYRRPLIIAGAVAAVLIAIILATRFWEYDSPAQRAVRAYQLGTRIERVQDSVNFGYDDVAASFVNEYVDYTYYHKGNDRVGYASDYVFQGKSAVGTFKEAVNNQYSSVQPGFDPLICGTSAPVSVKYSRGFGMLSMLGYGNMEANFTYADGSQGQVDYQLQLDQSKTVHGTWYIIGVTCTTLNNASKHPYVLKDELGDNARAYDARNDRTFSN